MHDFIRLTIEHRENRRKEERKKNEEALKKRLQQEEKDRLLALRRKEIDYSSPVIKERLRPQVKDMTSMQQLNQSITKLAKESICSNCFELESKQVYKDQNFDHEEFENDVPKIERDFSIDMKKFKFTKEAAKSIMTLQHAKDERRAKADLLYKLHLNIKGGDSFAKKFTAEYNRKLRKSIDHLDKKFLYFTSLNEETQRKLCHYNFEVPDPAALDRVYNASFNQSKALKEQLEQMPTSVIDVKDSSLHSRVSATLG